MIVFDLDTTDTGLKTYYFMYNFLYICNLIKYFKNMVVISSTDLRSQQKRYFDMAEKENVIVKRGNKFIHLVVSDKAVITKNKLEQGITGNELKKRVFKHIDDIFD